MTGLEPVMREAKSRALPAWLHPNVVPGMGFEPTRLEAREPKSRTSANSVTPAYGAESGIRTHGPFRDHQFSRLAP